MTAFLAIVLDTWRQSRQQVVFLVMLAMLALVAVATIVVPQPFEQPDGSERIGFVFADEASPFLERTWETLYAQSLMVHSDAPVNMLDAEALDAEQERIRPLIEAAINDSGISMKQRSVEVIMSMVVGLIYTLSMLLFLAACAGYFPNMLESGAIDIVLSRPMDRLHIFLGKYFGGLALYAAAIGGTFMLIYIGVGLRTGVWVGGIFLAMPMMVFSAAVLYAILAALGVRKPSANLCLVVGLLFYLVVDAAVGALIQMQRMGVLHDIPWLDNIAEVVRYTLPNFDALKANAIASVLNMPMMEWQPFLVAFAWLALCLTLGYRRFARTDY